MKSFGVFSWVILLFSFTQAGAQSDCIDVKQAQEIRQLLKMPETAVDSELCDPTSKTYKIFETLVFMKNLKFDDKAIPAPLNQSILPGNFWEYFMRYATEIVFQDTPGSCTNVIAFTLGALKDGVILTCPLFYEADRTLAERVSILLHEVRHFDGYTHIICTNAPNKGRKSCDTSIEEKGSYAVSVEAMIKLAVLAPNLDARNRAFAKNMALQLSQMAFNEQVKFADESLFSIYLVSTDQKSGLIYNGDTLFKAPAIADSRLISRKYSLAVFPNDLTDTYTADLYTSSPGKVMAFGGTSKKYNQTPKEQRTPIVDILINPSYQALISSNRIEVNELPPINLTWTPQSVFTAEEMGDSKTDAFYIADTQGQLRYVQWTSGAIEISDVSNDKVKDLASIVVFNGQRYALNKSGDILVFTNNDWRPAEQFLGQKFKALTRPFLWSQYLISE